LVILKVHYSVVQNHDDWAHAFAAFLDYIEIEKVHLVGAGIGGLLIQNFAVHYPARVISLVLVNTYSGMCDFYFFSFFFR
jgi:pimeloyl-ACP methyl ester carboxylesterase